MSVLKELIDAVTGLVKSRVEGVGQKVRKTGKALPFCFLATVMALWGLALLIAALFIVLVPHVGAAGAAVISSGAALLGAAVMGLIAMMLMSKD
ncbi:MAG: hypothetical protein ACE15C_09755 [Phycisphaerae bacterium]